MGGYALCAHGKTATTENSHGQQPQEQLHYSIHDEMLQIISQQIKTWMAKTTSTETEKDRSLLFGLKSLLCITFPVSGAVYSLISWLRE